MGYALLQSALQVDIDIIDACLNHGADVNTTDAYGNAALILVSEIAVRQQAAGLI